MNVVSLFAGIGGFDLAFERADANVTAQVELEKQCRTLLAQKFPYARRFGDICDVKGADLGRPDVLIGGFPCQDISIAGGRAGLAGARSGLWYEFARLIEETRPEWIVAENVAGLLSSGGRRDMGAVLGTLANLGYGFAYRVLDAQFFGVPQRRRRVFIVGRAGADRRGPREVLLEPQGVRRDSRARSEAREEVAGTLAARTRGGGFPGTDEACSGYLQPVVITNTAGDTRLGLGGRGGDRVSLSLTNSHGNPGIVCQPRIAATLSAGSHRPGVNPPGRRQEDDTNVVAYGPIPVSVRGRPEATLESGEPLYAVRKLMPIECERLQGFPDGWTEGFSDTVRYRMLGNAVAVPVLEWIARRLVGSAA